MTRLRSVLLIALGIVVGAVLGPPSYAVAKDAVTQVFVTNTSANPIPVTGSVSVDEPVTVDGSVSVADNREPFETRVDLNLATGQSADTFSFSVPAGKRLVVEFVSAYVGLPSGQTPLVAANAVNAALGYAIPVALQGVGNGNAFWTGATPVLEFEDGSYVISLERQNPGGGALSGTASGFVYVSGYLLPQ